MTQPRRLVTFDLAGLKCALPASVVQRVIRVVEVTPLPAAPAVVAGVIDVHGLVVPVYDLRMRLDLPARAVRLSDQMIIASTAKRTVAVLVDAVDDVVEIAEDAVTAAGDVAPGLDAVDGVARTGDGMVLIHDLDALLSVAEESVLSAAIEASGSRGSHDA